MLKRNCGENGVNDEWAGNLTVAQKTPKDGPVPLARLEDAGAG